MSGSDGCAYCAGEEWGLANTRILERDSHAWVSLVGDRRATVGQVEPTRITMRDYNPFRVRRARADGWSREGARARVRERDEGCHRDVDVSRR